MKKAGYDIEMAREVGHVKLTYMRELRVVDNARPVPGAESLN